MSLTAPVPLILLALQQGFTSPPSSDTAGYWHQRVSYTITAKLDERAERVRASSTLRYANNSPDTLREMFVHQYLNAFRPGSRWSAADAAEGRVRFQRLRDPEYGYERFTAPVRVNGRPVSVDYPGAPDSTVARFALPQPLVPGDSVHVAFEWDARPSTTPRRQGRRGRHWDLAQWYPKVAVYDRGGWQHNALQPAGEFYGEFGTYDVTLVLPDDQIIGATGVPVSGDPGWARARRAGAAHTAERAYGGVATMPLPDVPAGHKVVRFLARDVHHFAWSASPDYRYEGGVYLRALPDTRWKSWDTVAIHALYRPGDDSTWGGMRVVQRTINAMRWLEAIYGPYAYPQMTVLHRLDGGGTEFPMMQMNGSPSQGLILHEGGHVWTYGILANNEWRSGWLDEGLTSYQTEWAQGLTPQERVRAGAVDRFTAPSGYRARGVPLALPRFDAIGLQRTLTDLEGEAEPIGTIAREFRDFDTYNDMIYSRAQVMYGQLRDVLGDTLWRDFLADYYSRWALKHVDERAMRGSAERVSGRQLEWFFDQWVHRTGVMDYALGDVRRTRDGARWITEVEVIRRGEYGHVTSVGVRTSRGWVTGDATDPLARRQTVRITTGEAPLEVRLDPHHYSWDWDRRNDVERSRPHFNFDWPLLQQGDRERSMLLARPMAWYSEPGGVTAGLRLRSSYLASLDRREVGVVYAARPGVAAASAAQYWIRIADPYLPFMTRPAMGWTAGVARLDDVVVVDIGRERTRRAKQSTVTTAVKLNAMNGVADALRPPEWSRGAKADLSARSALRRATGEGEAYFFELAGVAGGGDGFAFAKGEIASGGLYSWFDERVVTAVRLYFGGTVGDMIPERALYLSVQDPLATFHQHWWRPAGAVFKHSAVNAVPLGGAALRGFHWRLSSDEVHALNVDVSHRLINTQGVSRTLDVRGHAFGDGAHLGAGADATWLADAGVGLSARGRIYDRDVHIRLDSPVYVSDPALAIDRGRAGSRRVGPRWVLTFNDIW